MTRAWLNAPEDKFLWFLPSQIECTAGQLYWYVHGHHRGCALHAMLAFYFSYGCHRGLELPCCLVSMAVGIPTDIADGSATRLEVVSRGMARTLKMPHGTTKVAWVDIIVALRQLCSGAGASTLSNTQPDKLQEALKERAPAFYDKVADWQRIRQVLQRVSPECIIALLESNSRHGAGGFPQTWFRQSCALLESPERKRHQRKIMQSCLRLSFCLCAASWPKWRHWIPNEGRSCRMAVPRHRAERTWLSNKSSKV